jgi:hypothetical protein
MAKTIGPLYSATAHGTVGQLLTLLHQQGRGIAKKKSQPTGAPSPTQVARRAVYASAVAAWRALSAPEKLAWSAIGGTRRITGYNAYLSDALAAAPAPAGTAWDGGAAVWDGGAAVWD